MSNEPGAAGRRASPLDRQSIEVDACTLDVKRRVLRGLPFFADLTDADIVRCCDVFHDHGYAPGKPVYVAGEPAVRLFVVAHGKVRLERAGDNGQAFLIDMLGNGEFCGSLRLLGEDTYSDTAVAHVQSCVLGVESSDFHSILTRFPSVSLRLLGILSERLRSAHEQVEMLGSHPVEGRIAFTLLRLAARFGEKRRADTLIQVPLSREELGAMAGTTIESASRVLSRLARQGVIRSGRQWVAIVDSDKLSALAAAASD